MASAFPPQPRLAAVFAAALGVAAGVAAGPRAAVAALAAPRAAAAPARVEAAFSAEALRLPPDPRSPDEKVAPGLVLRAASAAADEELDVLVTFREPDAVRKASAGGPLGPARRGWIARTGDQVAGDLAGEGVRLSGRFPNLAVVRASVTPRGLAALAADPRVLGVTRNGVKRALDAEGDAVLDVPAVRGLGLDGSGVGIAVVDTGVDDTHPELPAGTKVARLWNAIGHDTDTHDGYGHGTAVAGIAAGLLTGVARGAMVAAVKVLDDTGYGTDADVLEGLDAVLASVANGNPYRIRVANMSLGGYFDEVKPPEPGRCDVLAPDYKAAFDALAAAGVLVVAASGNGGCTSGIAVPACISTALSVGAVYDADIGPAAFGHDQCTPSGCSDPKTGPDVVACYSDSGDRLDVFAPSFNARAPARGGGYLTRFGGTSAAAPYVSGVAALLAGASPGATPLELKGAIRETGTPLTDPRNGITRNRVDAYAALQRLLAPSSGSASRTLVVPIVLDAAGGGGARYTTELTLGNHGKTSSLVTLSYVAATRALPSAAGTGSMTTALAPGEQRVIPDAVAFLRDAGGLAIPVSGDQGGTLRITFTGLSDARAATALARTTSAVCNGSAGLAYPGVAVPAADAGPLVLFGLRDTAADRTNLAVVNAGTEGSATLRIVLVDGDPASGGATHEVDLPALGPGDWYQVGREKLLAAAGFTQGWARVERIAGDAPFTAYAVFNDNGTNDGSFVPAVPAGRAAATLTVPVLVESASYGSELILTNPTAEEATAILTWTEARGPEPGTGGSATVRLARNEQRILPEAVDWLRSQGIAIGARGPTIAGTLDVSFVAPSGSPVAGLAGVRTATADGASCRGGSYGLFYPAIGSTEAAADEAWVVGLAQNGTTRANLALFGTADGAGDLVVRYEVLDGTTGQVAFASEPIPLPPGAWTQVDGVLKGLAVTSAQVRVSRVSGVGRFAAYGVLNDGALPGERTGDGSYVAMTGVR